MQDKEWFKSWFDTTWYHLLYRHRDEEEARRFMSRLTSFFPVPSGARILDLACGKGRHAAFLAEKGYEVTGIDLSPESIRTAKKMESELLRFEVADMRRWQRPQYFDFIFNLFTSFGYFESDDEHLRALKNMAASLRKNGKIVIDFLNAEKVRNSLIDSEIKEIEGITFHIRRRIETGAVIKTIEVIDSGQSHHFEERVRLFTPEDFKHLFAQAGLRIVRLFGDYELNAYTKDSDRLIVIGECVG